MLLRLHPDQWVPVPGTPIELHAECDTMVRRDDHTGMWDIGLVPGVLLARIVRPNGHRSWPWPITPLPYRTPPAATPPQTSEPTTTPAPPTHTTPPPTATESRLAAALGWPQPPQLSNHERQQLDAEFDAAQAHARRFYGLDTPADQPTRSPTLVINRPDTATVTHPPGPATSQPRTLPN